MTEELGWHVWRVQEHLNFRFRHAARENRLVHLLWLPAYQPGESSGAHVDLWRDPQAYTDVAEVAVSLGVRIC